MSPTATNSFAVSILELAVMRAAIDMLGDTCFESSLIESLNGNTRSKESSQRLEILKTCDGLRTRIDNALNHIDTDALKTLLNALQNGETLTPKN